MTYADPAICTGEMRATPPGGWVTVSPPSESMRRAENLARRQEGFRRLVDWLFYPENYEPVEEGLIGAPLTVLSRDTDGRSGEPCDGRPIFAPLGEVERYLKLLRRPRWQICG